jgi:hypothetical protein
MNRMKKFLGVICLLTIGLCASAQVTKDHAFQAMDNLLDGKWELKGFFMDGNKFTQEYEVTKILKGTTYSVKTYGNTAKNGSQHGLRNEGLRGWNKVTKTMDFVEADVFGVFTIGEVVIEGMDILYVYEYGGQTITEAWIYKGPNIYEFIIGTRAESGQWTDITVNGGISRK